MLAKNKRLNLNQDFGWVAAGQKRETASVKLFYRSGENLTPKVGIALSKRLFNKSHQRHQASRMISQAVEVIYPRLSKKINLVIMPKPTVLKTEPEKLINELSDVKDLYSSD